MIVSKKVSNKSIYNRNVMDKRALVRIIPKWILIEMLWRKVLI